MEAVYHLYCDEGISSKISPSIPQLESAYGVKISYLPGQYSISRGSATVFQHQQAKHTLIKLINCGSSPSQWFWGSHSGFVPYDASSNHFIEGAYNNNLMEVALTINNRIYRLDFTQMTQKSISALIPRPICRIPPAEPPRRVTNYSKEVWSYTCEKWKRPKIFPGIVIRLLRNAAEKQQNIEVTLNQQSYRVDILAMKMFDSANREYILIRE